MDDSSPGQIQAYSSPAGTLRRRSEMDATSPECPRQKGRDGEDGEVKKRGEKNSLCRGNAAVSHFGCV